jgi:hypothetical protein
MDSPKQMDQGQPPMQQQGEVQRPRKQATQQQAGGKPVEPQAAQPQMQGAQFTDWASI